MLVPASGGNHAIGRAVRLARVDFFAGGFFVIVVQHLAFAHAVVGGVAASGVADGKAIIAPGRQLEFHTGDEIAVFARGVNRPTFFGLALDRAVHDLVFVGRAGPAFEIAAIEDGLEPFAPARSEQAIGFIGTDLAQEDIPPAGFAVVSLELNRAARRDGFEMIGAGRIVVIFKERVIHGKFAVQPDADARADHKDANRVPFAKRFIGQDERVFAGRAGTVVPEAAGA